METCLDHMVVRHGKVSQPAWYTEYLLKQDNIVNLFFTPVPVTGRFEGLSHNDSMMVMPTSSEWGAFYQDDCGGMLKSDAMWIEVCVLFIWHWVITDF